MLRGGGNYPGQYMGQHRYADFRHISAAFPFFFCTICRYKKLMRLCFARDFPSTITAETGKVSENTASLAGYMRSVSWHMIVLDAEGIVLPKKLA